MSPSTSPPRSPSRRFHRRRWGSLLTVSILIGLMLFLTPSTNSIIRRAVPGWAPADIITKADFDRLNVYRPEPDSGGERRLHVFMPADSPHMNLCKTIMSSVALGYPLPTLLNWNGEYNHPGWHFGGSHIAKLESLLAMIEELLRAADDGGDASEHDLVLLVDAYDVWFQLPPSVLIERYDRLNREADERVKREWEAAHGLATNFPVPPPKQSIVITSAKHCSPEAFSGSDPNYKYWPQSPKREDMYGRKTDRVPTFSLDPARMYKNVRPRCVNSGMIMGTMGSLWHALRRAKDKVEQVSRSGRQLWSDQALIGEVIGDQEIWRTWMKELGATWNGTESESDTAMFPAEMRRIARDSMAGANFEFGIGLDYNFTTIPPTCSAEEDAYFVRLDDGETVEMESRKAGVSGDVRVDGVPPELLSHNLDAEDALSDVNWGAEPLYTDFFFGVTPVGIHHNAYVENLKPRRLREWWSKTWFYPHLRTLVTKNLRKRSSPVLGVLPPNYSGSEERVFRGSKTSRRGSVTVFEQSSNASVQLTPISWDGVCQNSEEPWYDELFGDGNGPLEV